MTIDEWFYDSVPELYEEYIAAHDKHPVFPTPGKHEMTIIVEELGEAAQAYNDGDYRNAITEIDHTITTLLRWRRKIKEGVGR